ncbi:hypothetical protein AN958_09274 [Leucoagaricus sp. SymC.cos]|nr:hypothetical protein AN958_09274 [Leucoagaricus sp. SymC.cos]
MSSVKCHSAAPDITPPPTRDTDYYFEKGDCIIRAENCLFKIHRFLLERDSPIFQDLFSLPQSAGTLRQFHGKAYYMYIKNVVMLHSSSESLIELGNFAAFVNLDTSVLNELRCHRLCQGFWSLAQLSMKLLAAVPRLNDNTSCTDHSSICIPTWNTWWKAESTGLPVQTHYDPRVLIESMQNLANSDRELISVFRSGYDYDGLVETFEAEMPIPCKARILDQLEEMTRIFDDTVADHFMLPHD